MTAVKLNGDGIDSETLIEELMQLAKRDCNTCAMKVLDAAAMISYMETEITILRSQQANQAEFIIKLHIENERLMKALNSAYLEKL